MNNNNIKTDDIKTGNIDNTILFYIYYPNSSIESNAIIIEKQIEIALLSNLKQINIGLFDISKNSDETTSIINKIIKHAKERLSLRYKMEKKHIADLYVNLIYFNEGNLINTLDTLLYTTYFFPEKQENKKNIKDKYSFVLLNDGYNLIDNKENTNDKKKEDKIIQNIKNNLNPNIIFSKISFNENVEKLSSTYIRNIAISSNNTHQKFDDMMMKLGYNKKNSDEILNVIRNSSNLMTMGDIFNKTKSMISNLGANFSSKVTDVVNNATALNYVNNFNRSGNNNVYYAINGGKTKHKNKRKTKNKRKNKKQTKKQKNKQKTNEKTKNK